MLLGISHTDLELHPILVLPLFWYIDGDSHPVVGPARPKCVPLLALHILLLLGNVKGGLCADVWAPLAHGDDLFVIGAIFEEDRAKIVAGELATNEVVESPLLLAPDGGTSNRLGCVGSQDRVGHDVACVCVCVSCKVETGYREAW